MSKENPTLQDVLEWHNTVSRWIVMNFTVTPDMNAALDAVLQLRDLARLSLPVPDRTQLRWGLMNDPYCHAAYALGRREGIDAAEAEHSQRRGIVHILPKQEPV